MKDKQNKHKTGEGKTGMVVFGSITILALVVAGIGWLWLSRDYKDCGVPGGHQWFLDCCLCFAFPF